MKVDTVKKPQQILNGQNPHVFEIHTPTSVFYIGEDPSGDDQNVMNSPESGVGREQAICWEHAIRQALMPVTPQASQDAEKNSQLSQLI